MSVPKQRHTKTRRDRKRKRFTMSLKKMQKCPKCSTPKFPHVVCPNCGYYKGKEILDTMKKAEKKKKQK